MKPARKHSEQYAQGLRRKLHARRARFPLETKITGKRHAVAMRLVRNGSQDTLSRDALDTADKSVERRTSRWPGHAPSEQHGSVWTETFRAANCFVCGSR